MQILRLKNRKGTWLSVVIIVAGCLLVLHAVSSLALDVTGIFRGYMEISDVELIAVPRMEFDLALRERLWHSSMRATFTDGQFFSLSFMDNRTFDWLSVQSILAFAPINNKFSYLRNLARFRFEDIAFANQFYLPEQKDRAYDQITIDGRIENVRLRSMMRFSLFPIEFSSASLYANWDWVKCGLRFSSFLLMTEGDGFDRFRLTATYSEVPYLTFGAVTTDFLIAMEYKTNSKSVTPELHTRTDTSVLCVTPMLELITEETPLSLDGLKMYGIVLEYSLGNVAFYAATSFAEAKNRELTGRTDYYEVYRLRGRTPSCCGTENRFEVAFYFDDDSVRLFNWGATMVSIDFETGGGVGWNLKTEFTADSEWLLEAGWNLRF